MDEEHLAAALRYVSLNPVRARLVERAQDWRWSSTRAHLRGKDDGVTALAPVRDRFSSFADLIANKVRGSGAFQEVARTATPGKVLSVSGRITRLTEGSSALRFWVGMGAGSSYFEATTELSDAESGASLGTIHTDKNSWALGGGIASAQTVQSFMEGASDKIATQLRDSRKGLPAPKKN